MEMLGPLVTQEPRYGILVLRVYATEYYMDVFVVPEYTQFATGIPLPLT